MKREVNLFAVGGIILLVILLVVAAVSLTRCGSAPAPTEPTVAEPTEAETQPTETEEPTEPPHVHEYEETVTEPDCISGGYTTFVCACGDSYVGNETEALGHSWKDATCTEPKTCTACGVTEGRANGHKWDEGTVTIPAEENKEGEKLFTCTVCKATKTQVIPTLDHVHNYEETVEITPPTCTEDGYTTHTCRCGDSKVDSEVKALGHTMSEATCTKPEVCSVCGTTGKAALGHKWNPATCTEPMTCSVCGETAGVPRGHKETTVKGHDATCTETGLKDGIQCSGCKTWIKEKEVIPAKGHKEKTVKGKDPTCTETGLTDGIQCSVCNVWIKEQEVIPELGHQEETVTGKDSTCTETGLTDGVQCTRCKVWIEKQEVIEKKTHTEKTVKGYEATCTKTGLTDGTQCSLCSTWLKKQETIPLKDHTPQTVKGYEATCTKTGLTDGTKCSVCSTWIKKQETIPLKDHTPQTVKGYEATCTVDGKTDGIQCSVCKTWIDERDTILSLGHTEEVIKGYAATCTSGGYTDGVKCSVCYVTIVYQEYIEKLGHNYSDWTVESEATCGTNGKQIRICSRCPETEEQIIKATGNHSYDKCVCQVCGYIFEGTPDLTYQLSDDKTYYICTGTTDWTPPKNLVIPAYHNGKPVKRIGNSAFMGASFTSITFPETLEYIGSDAFFYDDELKEIIIPASVWYIGDGAFKYCYLERAYFYTTGWMRKGKTIDLSDPHIAAAELEERGDLSR